MTFGYSRDDAERTFLGVYVDNGILQKNPFQVLDRDGVGRLMKQAIEEVAKFDRTLKSVFAASMVVTPVRSSSAT